MKFNKTDNSTPHLYMSNVDSWIQLYIHNKILNGNGPYFFIYTLTVTT